MQFKNIPKFPDHCPIFMEVIAKKNIKQTDKFTTCESKKFLERDNQKLKFFQEKNKSYQNWSIL